VSVRAFFCSFVEAAALLHGAAAAAVSVGVAVATAVGAVSIVHKSVAPAAGALASMGARCAGVRVRFAAE